MTLELSPPNLPAEPALRTGFYRRVSSALGRVGWGIADQGVSSISNFAVNIYIARTLGAASYGAFALAYVTYGFALNASRGLATEPLLVRHSGTDVATWRRAVASCTGTAAVVGLITGVITVAAGLAMRGDSRGAFLALGLTLPGLLLQDSFRYSFFAIGRGLKAIVNDTVWVVVVLIALIFLRLYGVHDVFWFVLAWGASGSVAAAIGPLQARVLPRLRDAHRWVIAHRTLGPRFLMENISGSIGNQLRAYGVGLVLGLAVLGYAQAAATVMGPFMVVYFGMGLVLVPEAARVLRISPRKLYPYAATVTGGLSLLAVAWGGLLLAVIPLGVGQALLGSLWRPMYPLLLPLTIATVGFCMGTGPGSALHALGAARRSLKAMALMSVALVVFSIIGAILGGAVGMMDGTALASWAGGVLYWRELHHALRELDDIPVRDGVIQSLRRAFS